MTLIKKWKNCLDQKGYTGAVLVDLSKAFDTINQVLLIAKLHAYGFSKISVKIILSYLSNRYQRVKSLAMVTTRLTTFSSWRKLIQRVPEVPDLEPILFNTYLNYLFFLLNDIDICNFADDTAAYVCDIKLESVAEKLEENSESAVPWLEKNYTKLHTDKCH